MLKKKIDIPEEKDTRKKEEIDESQWSFKRIALFTLIVGLLGFLVFYFIQSRTGHVLGEMENSRRSSSPQIEIPSQESIDEIIRSAEENISNIDAGDMVSSQPHIKQAIEQLEKLTSKDNFKETFCKSICSE